MFFNTMRCIYDLHKLRKNQWLSPVELRKLQEKKLQRLLCHAYYKVDYYKEIFDKARIKPEDIKNIQHLIRIPLTTRGDLQRLSKRKIIAKDVDLDHCLSLRTSGSSGMPLDIFWNTEAIFFEWLNYLRMYFENGGRLLDKELRITAPRNFSANKWFQSLGVLRKKCISIFDNVEGQLKAILEFKPDIIRSYASTLKDLAIEIKKKEIRGIKPRVMFSTAELLTKEDKKFISSVFQSELIDFYSCNECGIIAWECKEHSGYHINSENVIVEFIKEDGTSAEAGEKGEMVITSLSSYAMPFIRYRLGDTGVSSNERCACGRNLPLMKIITGRINDHLILPNGRTISPYSCMITMDRIPEVKMYQIVQEKDSKIKINILKNGMITNEIITKVRNRYKELLGDDLDIMPTVAENIYKGKTGKSKIIMSKISDNDN